jgi:hypothetical protein
MILPTESEVFEEEFGFAPPDALLELLADDSLAAAMPAGFRLAHVEYVVELQYLLSLRDRENYDVSRKRVACAVTTDGCRLLVDLSSKDLDLLQDEFGDVESIGVTVKQLLTGERYSLSRGPAAV